MSIEERVAFQQRLIDEIGSVPGVAAAAAATHIPLSGDSWYHFFRIPSVSGDERQASRFTYVSPGYFATLRIPLRAGRDFERFDNPSSPRVMLVNESFVRSHLRGQSPLGITLRTMAEAGYPETTYEIIGVVGNTKYRISAKRCRRLRSCQWRRILGCSRGRPCSCAPAHLGLG